MDTKAVSIGLSRIGPMPAFEPYANCNSNIVKCNQALCKIRYRDCLSTGVVEWYVPKIQRGRNTSTPPLGGP